jgi:hypothetical protein
MMGMNIQWSSSPPLFAARDQLVIRDWWLSASRIKEHVKRAYELAYIMEGEGGQGKNLKKGSRIPGFEGPRGMEKIVRSSGVRSEIVARAL